MILGLFHNRESRDALWRFVDFGRRRINATGNVMMRAMETHGAVNQTKLIVHLSIVRIVNDALDYSIVGVFTRRRSSDFLPLVMQENIAPNPVANTSDLRRPSTSLDKVSGVTSLQVPRRVKVSTVKLPSNTLPDLDAAHIIVAERYSPGERQRPSRFFDSL